MKNNNNNYWMTATFSMMMIISVLAGFTANLKFVKLNPSLSVNVFLWLVLSLAAIQVPVIVKNLIEGLKDESKKTKK